MAAQQSPLVLNFRGYHEADGVSFATTAPIRNVWKTKRRTLPQQRIVGFRGVYRPMTGGSVWNNHPIRIRVGGAFVLGSGGEARPRDLVVGKCTHRWAPCIQKSQTVSNIPLLVSNACTSTSVDASSPLSTEKLRGTACACNRR